MGLEKINLGKEDTAQAMLYWLSVIADRLPRQDAADRGIVAFESAQAISGTVAVSTLPTLPTVTTVSNVTAVQTLGANQSFAGQIPQNIGQLGALHIYNNIVVT
jgi:hypothetical protein